MAEFALEMLPQGGIFNRLNTGSDWFGISAGHVEFTPRNGSPVTDDSRPAAPDPTTCGVTSGRA